MYYCLEQNTKLARKYAYFGDEPESYDLSDWITGKKMSQAPSFITITSDEGKPQQLTDFLLTHFNSLIFSPKIISVLEDMGIKNIDYYPVTVINHETSEATVTYKAAHIIGRIPCLDKDRSKCSFFSGQDKLRKVEKFSIHEGMIKPTAEMGGQVLIFRLDEFPYIVLVHESIKDRFEKEGITGAKFVKTEDYI